MVKDLEEKMAALSPEELEAYMESIPEWKRGALVVTEPGEEEQEVQGIFKKIRSKISGKIQDTSLVKSFKEDENVQWARKEYQQVKGDAREQIEMSHNPLVRGASQAADKITAETSWTKAVREMKRYDAHFDLEELPFEAEEIFREFYCNYLSGNREYLEKVSTGPVALLHAMIDLRNKEGWKYKY